MDIIDSNIKIRVFNHDFFVVFLFNDIVNHSPLKDDKINFIEQ